MNYFGRPSGVQQVMKIIKSSDLVEFSLIFIVTLILMGCAYIIYGCLHETPECIFYKEKTDFLDKRMKEIKKREEAWKRP